MTALLTACVVLAFNVEAAREDGSDIVVRAEKDGPSFAVKAEMLIDASLDEVWAVLVDFDNMARILSNVDESRITNRDGDKFEVIQKSHASAGPLRLTLDSVREVELVPKREIRSHLLKGDLKSSDFVTRVQPEGAGVKVTLSGSFVARGLASGAISQDTVERQTRRQYQELREEIMRRKTNAPTPPCLLAKNCPQ